MYIIDGDNDDITNSVKSRELNFQNQYIILISCFLLKKLHLAQVPHDTVYKTNVVLLLCYVAVLYSLRISMRIFRILYSSLLLANLLFTHSHAFFSCVVFSHSWCGSNNCHCFILPSPTQYDWVKSLLHYEAFHRGIIILWFISFLRKTETLNIKRNIFKNSFFIAACFSFQILIASPHAFTWLPIFEQSLP